MLLRRSCSRTILLSFIFMLSCSFRGINASSDNNNNDGDIALTPDMPNVCSKVETRSVTQVVPCVKSYDHLVKVWSKNCTNGRRICPVYEHRTEYYKSEQTVTKEVNVTIYHCCLGWTRLNHDYGCPIAMQPNRVQRKINLNQRPSHYADPNHHRCPHNRFGMRCEYSCSQCIFGTCNWRLKICECHPGYTGTFCNQSITNNRQRNDPTNRCQLCHKGNTASCQMDTGKCQCLPGHQGIRCEEDRKLIHCPNNHYGRDCVYQCTCQNGGKCDPRDGHCFCQSGYTGIKCESECPKGTFGHLCMQKCQCGNSLECHPRTGECNPSACNKDPKCLFDQQRKIQMVTSCPEGFYGPPTCRAKCVCMNNAQCDPINGRCQCHMGFVGRYCERSCEHGWYGPGCIHRCDCHNGATCDSRTGVCHCGLGFTGQLCDQECPEGTFGRNCSETCLCQNGARCNKLTGCCSCAVGYYGSTCQSECRPFRFGFYCSQTCNCSNNTSNGCDHKTGQCRCKAGFYGPQCDEECPPGNWGEGCANRCDCSGNTCDAQDGTCLCPAGRTGVRCEEDCPENTFGVGCEPCSCQSFQTCDSITGGCQCPAGWKGDACQFPLSANGPDMPERGDLYKKNT